MYHLIQTRNKRQIPFHCFLRGTAQLVQDLRIEISENYTKLLLRVNPFKLQFVEEIYQIKV